MARSTPNPLRGIRAYVRSHRHTAQLIALVLAFLVRPLIGDTGASPIVFGLAMMVLMLSSLYTIQIDDMVGDRGKLLSERRRQTVVGLLLATAALIERIGALVAPSHQLILVGSLGWLLFFAFVTVSQLRSLLRQKDVTGETLSMSMSIYLLIGLTWGLLYVVIFQRDPHAFNLGNDAVGEGAYRQTHIFPILIYFSLTTLSTIGFGDITPLTLQARYAAVAEGITGQLYLAVLVARLVGMHMSRPAAH